ncbi:YciI family protein [Actibacterium sp. 188UL27-1]|uniref:YciI family protein n=1 Tax=Actibacterium sp. 188UL27-1 TaxID=2786961 RepID=UPI001957F6CD|nr:YciI family protein [Actibacterium sp. 188UL27-1]MBM7070154.1 hypothetical protein [Actibacterium sp. 188UL27-1]
MPKFILAYHGSPKLETKEEGQAHMAAWRDWMSGMGDAVIDPGMPVGPSKTIQTDGTVADNGGANPLSGITIIQAKTMDDAIAMAKPCPHVTAGGSIEVAQALDMDM